MHNVIKHFRTGAGLSWRSTRSLFVLCGTSVVEEIRARLCHIISVHSQVGGLLLKTLLFTVSFQNKSVIIISLMLLAYSGRSSVVFSCHLYSALLSHLTWCYRYDYRGIDNHTGDNWCSAWQLQVLDTSENFALGSPVVSLHSNPWASLHKAITLYSIVKDCILLYL